LGALNKLRAANERVTSVSGFITSIYEEVMGTEPSPFRPDIVPALEVVQLAAEGIVVATGKYNPPYGVPFEFIEALNDAAGSALSIVDNTQLYIEELTGCIPGAIDCADIHDPDTCNNFCACKGVPDDTGGGECRDVVP
jgi:hypothetical protein